MATRVLPGETRTVCLFDLSEPGVGPVTADAVVSFVLQDASGSVVAGPVTGAASGNDWCAVVTAPSTSGTYTLLASATYGGTTSEMVDTWEVRARLARLGTTRGELRQSIGHRLGDLVELQATKASTDGGAFYDAISLRRSDNQYASRDAYCARGAAANQGLTRIVQGSSQQSQSLTLQPPFPAPFALGDRLELTNDRGEGWLIAEYHRAIDDALRTAGGMGGVPLAAIITATFDATTPLLTLPDGFDALWGVEYRDQAGEWHLLQPAPRWGSGGWRTAGGGQIELLGQGRYLADGQQIRVRGYGRHDPLGDDDEATQVNAEWLVVECCRLLLLQGIRRDPDRDRLIPLIDKQASELRPQAVPLRKPGTVSIR